jgi:hypothetical protein
MLEPLPSICPAARGAAPLSLTHPPSSVCLVADLHESGELTPLKASDRASNLPSLSTLKD